MFCSVQRTIIKIKIDGLLRTYKLFLECSYNNFLKTIHHDYNENSKTMKPKKDE